MVTSTSQAKDDSFKLRGMRCTCRIRPIRVFKAGHKCPQMNKLRRGNLWIDASRLEEPPELLAVKIKGSLLIFVTVKEERARDRQECLSYHDHFQKVLFSVRDSR